MKKYLENIAFVIIVGIALVSCGGGEDAKKVDELIIVTAVASDGKIYYQYECAGCHSAGVDTTSAFGASNLDKKQALIKSNMAQFGKTTLNNVDTLMGRFSNLSEQRVADLKAYFESL